MSADSTGDEVLVETILIQYRDFEHDHEVSDPAAAGEKLAEWLADPGRSSHFNVRVRRRIERRNGP